MQTAAPLTRDLVLIGGGHAHALVLRRWGMDPMPGARLTVINPGPTAPYTGMLPGHVAGHYGRDALDIDLVRLARFAGARLINGAADALDPEGRRVHVAGRGWIAYDVASVDVGVTAAMPEIEGFAAHAVGAKPLGAFAEAWRAHRDAARAGERPGDAVVIGGGVAGVELALAMAHALGGIDARVAVVERGGGLSGTGARARSLLREAMERLGVALHTYASVARVEVERVVLEDGTTIPARFVTGAAGARPHAWLAAQGLPAEDGYLRVGPDLRVEGCRDLFAVGDCAHMVHAPRPKAGVFAVRQAPVLHHNLRVALGGGSFQRFQPQRTYLKLISLGARDAVAEKGGLTLSGPWLWRLKDRIDRAFMDRLTDLPAMPAPPPPARAARGAGELAAPLCGACGAKVGPDALARALSALPPPARADVASEPGDDAAILRHGDGWQVMTTDHLRAFWPDPALMARIAAVHALGDVWAMGAAPQAALAQIVLPRMSEALQARTLAEILSAAAPVLRDAGADLVGGHTTMGAEATIGFALTGLAAAPIRAGSARPGDALVLTRPLGSGVILAAEMRAAAPGAAVMAALAIMAMPQGGAAARLRGARAMTDVTGFGLAGHLARLVGNHGAEIDLAALPAYDGALVLLADGHRSSLHAANAAAAPVADAEGPRGALLHDPQTAGGLLAALDPAEADDAVADLRALGHRAARIGTVTEAPGLRSR